MTESMSNFIDRLWSLGFRKIYLCHYNENEQLARQLGKILKENGFEVTVAADARKLGKDFMSKCIGDCDLTMVLNPQSDVSHLILSAGGGIIDVMMEEPIQLTEANK